MKNASLLPIFVFALISLPAYALEFPSNWTCTQGSQITHVELRAQDGITPVAIVNGGAAVNCDKTMSQIDETHVLTCGDAINTLVLSIVNDSDLGVIVQGAYNHASIGQCQIDNR